MSLLEMFCDVDEFCVRMDAQQAAKQLGKGKRGAQATLCWSEVMTILIHFHQSHYRDFKAYYIEHVQKELRSEFPNLVSYNRFVELDVYKRQIQVIVTHHANEISDLRLTQDKS